jgi:uncharacterized protein (DUF2267 family)
MKRRVLTVTMQRRRETPDPDYEALRAYVIAVLTAAIEREHVEQINAAIERDGAMIH